MVEINRTAIERKRAEIAADVEWYQQRKAVVVANASTLDFAMDSTSFYDAMVGEARVKLALLDELLAPDTEWSVTSDELPDLAAGDDHWTLLGEGEDEDGYSTVLLQYQAEGR